MNFSSGPPSHRKILTGQMHALSQYCPGPGYNPVSRKRFALHSEQDGTMLSK